MEFFINRFKNVEEIEYQCEVVTPMFLGGADKNSAELRVPSIKGALRFWWRAVYGGKYPTIEAMAKEEAEIFGSTDKKASFSVRVEEKNITISQTPDQNSIEKYNVHGHDLSILDYLCYGVCNYDRILHKNVYQKEHIKPGAVFNLILSVYNKEYKEQLINSFKFLINFGGLGTKSRNGLGSLYIKEIEFSKPDFHNELLCFTGFSKYSKIFDNFQERNSWQESISDIGLLYRRARTTIENHYQYSKRKRISQPMMGMPQPKSRPIDYSDLKEKRHSKSYFLHVSKTQNNKFKGQILYLPYKYLYNSNEFSEQKLNEYNQAYQVLNNKIEQLMNGGTK